MTTGKTIAKDRKREKETCNHLQSCITTSTASTLPLLHEPQQRQPRSFLHIFLPSFFPTNTHQTPNPTPHLTSLLKYTTDLPHRLDFRIFTSHLPSQLIHPLFPQPSAQQTSDWGDGCGAAGERGWVKGWVARGVEEGVACGGKHWGLVVDCACGFDGFVVDGQVG